MSVISANERYDGRLFASDEASRTYDRVWRVRTNSRHDEGFVIQSSQLLFGIPIVGQVHPSDPKARVVRVRGNQSEGPFLWTVVASYSTEAKEEEDPENDPIEFEWDDEFTTEATKKDRDGFAMENSAGDPFDEPVDVEVGIKVVTFNPKISANAIPSWVFDLPAAADGRHTVNDRDIEIDGVPMLTETALFRRARVGKRETRNDIEFRRVEVEVAYPRS